MSFDPFCSSGSSVRPSVPPKTSSKAQRGHQFLHEVFLAGLDRNISHSTVPTFLVYSAYKFLTFVHNLQRIRFLQCTSSSIRISSFLWKADNLTPWASIPTRRQQLLALGSSCPVCGVAVSSLLHRPCGFLLPRSLWGQTLRADHHILVLMLFLPCRNPLLNSSHCQRKDLFIYLFFLMRGPWDFFNGSCIFHSFIVLLAPCYHLSLQPSVNLILAFMYIAHLSC